MSQSSVAFVSSVSLQGKSVGSDGWDYKIRITASAVDSAGVSRKLTADVKIHDVPNDKLAVEKAEAIMLRKVEAKWKL